jgi:hypothetical protein
MNNYVKLVLILTPEMNYTMININTNSIIGFLPMKDQCLYKGNWKFEQVPTMSASIVIF